MKICVDLRTAGNGPHGIGRYGAELVRALEALVPPGRLDVLTGGAGAGVGREGLGSGNVSPVRCPPRPYGLLEQLLVPRAVARLGPDIYHCPTYACPLFVPAPTVMTIHDLLPLEYPRDFSPGLRLYHKRLVRWAAKRARRIIAVSSYTASRVRRRFSLPAGKVRVIPEGGDHVRRFRVSSRDEQRYRELGAGGLDYFLTVSNPRPHKNVLFSVRCFLASERLRERKARYILVGRQHPAVHRCVEAGDRDGRVLFAGEVSDGLLRLLYEGAVAVLCPSRGEGFCLPAAEAMQFGLPVLAADDGALPEVVGAAGRLLSLDDQRGWREAMEQIQAARQVGEWDPSPVLERAGRFSWARAAEETMALYEEVCRGEGQRPKAKGPRRGERGC